MILLLCRKTEDAQYVSSQANGAKDEHEHPNNPEPLEEKKFMFLKYHYLTLFQESECDKMIMDACIAC